jgi:hypothetical protein
MKIWAERNYDNNIYKSILNNQQINIDIGGDDSQSDIPIPVTINVYDKDTNTCLSSYSHGLSIIQIISYIASYPRFNKLYDFEIIRLDKLDNEIHRDEGIKLLNEALQEYKITKNAMAETFDTEENKMIYNKTCNMVNIIQNTINEIKMENTKEDNSIDNN